MVFIKGIYQTKFGELWRKSLEDLILEAARGALKDARMRTSHVQLVFIANMLSSKVAGQQHLSALLVESLKVKAPVIRVEAACASGGMAISQAVAQLESEAVDNVLVIGAEKMTDLSPGEISQALMEAASAQGETGSGLSFVGLYALLARIYLEKFGAAEKDLANVSVKNHLHASFNPLAQFPFPITVEQVLKSKPVAEPLKLLDCSPITDGAAAVVLSRHKNGEKIRIRASGLAHDSLSLAKRKNLDRLEATEKAADLAYKEASVSPEDIDLVEAHDCFSIAEILALEDLKFYPKGEGYLALRNGEVKLGGKRPVNLSGGLKACGHPVGATGVKQIVELIRQLRLQTAKKDKMRLGLSHNVGGTGGTCVVNILERMD